MFLSLLRATGILLCLYVRPLPAQYTSASARAGAMGDASVCFTGIYSALSNQAGMASLEKPAFCATYENRFITRELNTCMAALGIPVRSYGVFGLVLFRSGFHLFSRNRISLSYARNFGRRFSAGMQFNYHLLYIGQGYGMAHIFSADAGIRIELGRQLTWALHVSNPVRQKLADFQKEKLPLVLKTGFMYTWNKALIAAAELAKDLDMPFDVRLGMEYLWKEQLALRAGFRTLPLSPSLGIGYRFRGISADMAWSYRPFAGFSPQVSFLWVSAKALK